MTFSAVSQAIKLANELGSIDKEVSQAELKLKVAEVTSSLAEIKLTLTEAKGDAVEKVDEIARLKKLQHRLQRGYRRALRLSVSEAKRRQGSGSW